MGRADLTLPSRRWIVEGKVQGVGFRWFVLRNAEQVGISGWTLNLPDGRVEVVGKGEDPALDQLEEALRRGPALARVKHVEKIDYPHDMVPDNSFNIK